MTNVELAEGFKANDKATFEAVYQHFSEDVRRIVFKYTPPNLRSEIEDIIQYMWVDFYQQAANYDPQRPLCNWIMFLACRAVKGYQKHVYRRTGLVKLCSNMATTVSLTPPVEDAAILREDFANAMEALEQIPLECQGPIREKLKGATPTEYAQQVGIPRKTVYSRLKRGYKALRRELNVPRKIT